MRERKSLDEAEDGVLLHRWVEHGDEVAVQVLTHRYAAMVTGTARRALGGNQSLAEEAAQSVFTIMVAKSASLQNHPSLNLWLHRAALLEARTLRRREARRSRLMARLAAESDAVKTPAIPPSTHRILSELDEALEYLPESDRCLLILRYYEGRSFRDIGMKLHKTDDTVQKQASRALEKLARLLHRRGAVTSASTLAALLSTEGLAPGAPAAALKFAGGAIAGASRISLASKSWHSIQFMCCGKTTTGVAAAAVLLLLVLSGGSGYYAGTQEEASGSGSLKRASTGRISGGPGPFEGNPNPPAWAAQGLPASPGDGARGRPPLLEILQAASTVRMDLTGEWSTYSEDMYPTLGHYDRDDTENAISLLGKFSEDANKFESVAGLIFSVMADSDWRAARERMMNADALRPDGKLSGQAIRAVAEAWGREEPEAAFRWANGLIENGRTPFNPERGVGETLLSDWLNRDTVGATSEMDKRLESQTPLVGKAVAKSIEERPQWWLDRLSAGTDPAAKEKTLRLARSSLVLLSPAQRQASVTRWVKDPGLAAEILQSVP